MEARERRWTVVGGLVVVLAIGIWWQFGRQPSVPGPVRAPAPATGETRTPTPAAPGQIAVAVPQVLIALLQQPRSEPGDPGRDLFKFATRPRPVDREARSGALAASRGGATQSPVGPGGLAGPAEAVAPPPIPLKFIGVVQKQGDRAKIAVLSDSHGVYHGREGDVIEGRYRIVRVGNESVELVYLDGRGRQVLRLSGG